MTFQYNEISSFEAALHDYMRSTHAALLHAINEAGAYDNEIEAKLTKAVEEFKRTGVGNSISRGSHCDRYTGHYY